ncbi:uncharacterized protein LOC111392264 [Olea europaea var. sylvestris]|uniref:uncharacterized protein LOC111392264 n=1 Tax=Olea europaea var. sylvestris TaxID=158386 RepID=UPI000C1D5196|nr:uncharacterized protein LOC111392264 [Olea europaea var. sylvestris]
MQKALPYRYWLSTTTIEGDSTNCPSGNRKTTDDDKAILKKLMTKYGGGFCPKRLPHVPCGLLLHGHGVNPIIFDVDEHHEAAVMNELSKIVTAEERCSTTGANFLAVFSAKIAWRA